MKHTTSVSDFVYYRYVSTCRLLVTLSNDHVFKIHKLSSVCV